MPTTIQDLIDQALLDLNTTQQGETPTAAERAQGLLKANLILSMLSTDRTMVYQQVHATFTLVPNVNSYTIGPSGTWVTAIRPVKIEGATAVSGLFRQGMEVLSFADFAQIDDGVGTSVSLPSRMGVDNAVPNVNVKVYPMPNSQASVETHFWTPFTAFAALDNVLSFPPGYDAVLQKLLVVELAPSYGKEVSTTLASALQNARQSLAELNASILGRSQQTEQQATAAKQ